MKRIANLIIFPRSFSYLEVPLRLISAWASFSLTLACTAISYLVWTMMVSNFRTLKVFGFLLGGLFAVVAWVRTYDVQLLARDKQKLAQQETIAWVNDFSWGNFSSLLAGFYRQNGYEVEEVNGGRGNIVDLLLRRDGKKTLVHCNHWKEFEVNVRTVKKLYRAQIQEGADKAVLITCGDYTKSALAFAEGKSLKLIAGNHCVEMVQQVQRNLRASGVPLPEVLMRKAA